MQDVLNAQGLTLKHDNHLLIDNVSLGLIPGEMVSLIGPNGAGKSTLLKLLTGLQPPDSGNLTLKGTPLSQWSNGDLSRQRAVMRQQTTLTFSWPVEEIIAMGRAPWPASLTPEVVTEVMALTGCDNLKGRDFCRLSGGEQQRVQLARALAQLWQAGSPQGWLFLDEPTSALDLYHQQHLLRLLKKLVSNGQLSVCAVLHDLNLAALWSDKIILLHRGRVEAYGTPEQVLREEILQRWYQADIKVYPHPEYQVPQVTLCQ